VSQQIGGWCGVVGTARLPRTLAGDQTAPLIIELAFDPSTGQVTDVATTLALPYYQTLLRTLVGHRLDDLETATRRAFANYRGPLLRPTLAAIASALANTGDSSNGLRSSA
jgi:hypothetical protein